jgi:hypothetical protein
VTLVASYEIGNWPVVVGDIMVSGLVPKQDTRPLNIPTYENANIRVSETSNRIVSGLLQKVNCLGAQLVLAWSGSSICARSVFRDILRQNSTPTFHDAVRVLNERQNENGMDLYLTGISIEAVQGPAQQSTRFAWDSEAGWNTKHRYFSKYNNCLAGGTGSDAFLDLLSLPIVDQPAQKSPMEMAICQSLGFLAKLTGDQIRTGVGIDETFFGGAFELATMFRGQIQKVGDISYHFWEARSEPSGDISMMPHVALKVEYFEDYLIIRKVSFGGQVADALGANEIYIIRPVHRTIDEAERKRLIASVPRPSMNARFAALYVHMPEKRAPHDCYVAVHKSGKEYWNGQIFFEEDGNGLDMRIHSDTLQRVQRALLPATGG